MKQTIGNLVYDTTKADLICEISSDGSTSDFRYFREFLYLTKKGNWFLYGEGGALSSYATKYMNMSSWGEKIIPLTRSEAFDWCERNACQDVIEDIFSDLIEEA